MEPITTADLAKMRRRSPEMKEYVQKTRAAQKDFRKWLDSQLVAEAKKEERFL